MQLHVQPLSSRLIVQRPAQGTSADPPWTRNMRHDPRRRHTAGAQSCCRLRLLLLAVPCKAVTKASMGKHVRGLSKGARELSNAIVEAGFFSILPREDGLVVLGFDCSGARQLDRGAPRRASACCNTAHLAGPLALDEALVPVVLGPVLPTDPRLVSTKAPPMVDRLQSAEAQHARRRLEGERQAAAAAAPSCHHTRSPPPLCRVVPVPLLLLASVCASACHSMPRFCGKTVSPWQTISSPCAAGHLSALCRPSLASRISLASCVSSRERPRTSTRDSNRHVDCKAGRQDSTHTAKI